MTLLLDENLSPSLGRLLADVFTAIEHVATVGLARASDTQIWEYARAHDLVVISKDSDFHQRSLVLPPRPDPPYRCDNGGLMAFKSRLIASSGLAAALLCLTQAPVAVQQVAGPVTIAAVDLASLREWDQTVSRMLRSGGVGVQRGS